MHLYPQIIEKLDQAIFTLTMLHIKETFSKITKNITLLHPCLPLRVINANLRVSPTIEKGKRLWEDYIHSAWQQESSKYARLISKQWLCLSNGYQYYLHFQKNRAFSHKVFAKSDASTNSYLPAYNPHLIPSFLFSLLVLPRRELWTWTPISLCISMLCWRHLQHISQMQKTDGFLAKTGNCINFSNNEARQK